MNMDVTRFRDEFPIAKEYIALTHCAVSPLNRRAADAVADHAREAAAQPFDRIRDKVMGTMTELKARAARLINAASPDEIAVIPNTAYGINTAALSLPLRAGDNVLVLDGAYPANLYPWMNLAHRGVLTKVVPQREGGLDLNVLQSRIDGRTRVIALDAVMFATGFRNDLEAVGRICRERGIFFVVDGIQALGALPIDVQACNIDILAAGSQKWLLGAPGSGFMYCRAALLPELVPGAYVGTSSMVDPFNFLDYNYTLQPNAERFSLGTPNILGAFALNASLALLEEAGREAVAERVLRLAGALISELGERGYGFAASTAPEHRSGIVIATMPQAEALAACERLAGERIMATVRGDGLRFAPHFYNTEDELMRVCEVLGDKV
jgi:selenocysteine lyase/cysteine desulfurase